MNLLRYAIVFLAIAIGVGVLVGVLNASADTALGSSAQLMVPAMIAALVEGQQYARDQKAKPKGAERWRFVWQATVVAVVLNVALAFGTGALLPEFGRLAVAPTLSQQFNMLLVLYAGGYMLCNFFFLGLGAGNQLSLMRRKDETE